jgi:hypothetical protein
MMAVGISKLLIAAALFATPVFAQAKSGLDQGPEARPLYRRDQWLPKSVPTSDTVLRVPMQADYNAPKGAFVLVGGRLFDGTGKAAGPATIVVQGKTNHHDIEAGRAELAEGRNRL